jgi:transcription antitermination factor NusG
MRERRERQGFNKLLMDISVGCQDLNRVVDNPFADFKGKYVKLSG